MELYETGSSSDPGVTTEPAVGRCRLSSGSRLSSFSAASIYFQSLRMHIGVSTSAAGFGSWPLRMITR